MKKLVITASLGLAAMAVAGVIVLRGISAREAEPAPGVTEVSAKSAEILQRKIDAIKEAHQTPGRTAGSASVELSEAELESYVLYILKEDIPARIDSIDVQLDAGAIAAGTQITFTSGATGNPMVDAVVGGTHDLFVKGRLEGDEGRGKFDLEEIRVDGIPVPRMLVEALIEKYARPKYPEVDLKEPFDLPWGIRRITIETGKATVLY